MTQLLNSLKRYKFLLIPLVLLMFIGIMITYYTDYLWYQSLDISQVFVKPLLSELGIKFVLWLIGLAFFIANLLPLAGTYSVKSQPKIVNQTFSLGFNVSKALIILISLGLSLFWVFVLPQMWDKVLLLLNSQPVGQVDPILGRDLSYYFFRYPLYALLSGTFMSLWTLTFMIVLVGYVLRSAINFAGFRSNLSPKALSHFSILLALFMIWYVFTRDLSIAGLLLSQSSALYGASYTDVNIALPILRIEQIVGLILAVLLLVNIRLKKVRLLFGAPALLFLLSFAGGMVGLGVERFMVSPNQLVRETPYLENHIQATREAYGLTNIEEVEYPINSGGISSEDLKANQETIDNIRLLDYRPLKQHYNQNQSLRLYYEFNDIDIDRYQIGDQTTQVMLSVRELNVDSLPGQAQTLINRHFKYTHGYGVAMSPVNKITSNGHPTYYLRDIPVKSEVDIPLERPEIYFGELTNEFVVVGTATGEFGSTQEGADEDEIVNYQGTDGVNLTPFRRLMYAMNFQKPILVFSNEITSESRILYNRNVKERINKVVPFIKLDSNAYPVVAEGKIYWIMDGYTTSSYYPYAQPSQGGNYMRNSVKIVVDAYNGDVGVYQFDENDPIMNAWEGVFPGLIQSREEFPEALEAHIRYPVDYFNIQTSILKNYHMTSSRDFYNRENVWELPVEKYSGEEIQVEPYYVTMQLPGSDEAQFILKQPFTPYNRNNMVGWLAAGNDGENYGNLLLFSFPRGKLIAGPSQVDAYIDQDPVISQQLSLWNQSGSNVVRGNLLTIPIDNNILYVEPLFILSESASIPELRRVILYYNDVLVMESSLDLALTKLFGKLGDNPASPGATGTGTAEKPDTPDVQEGPDTEASLKDLAAKINEIYLNQQKAAREGRWADYGTYSEQLETQINDLAKRVQ